MACDKTKLSAAALLATVILGGVPLPAHAMTGPMVDTVADVLTWVVIVLVPIGAIYLFWMVHILPEKIAEKRHHPQKDAIKTLCLLSLVFGGMLWPIAWLWAYSKPVMHKLAYGTDKHDDYYKAAEAEAQQEVAQLRDEIEQLDTAEHAAAAQLAELRDKLAQIEARLTTANGKETS